MKQNIPLLKSHRLVVPRIGYIVTTVNSKGLVNAGVYSNMTSVSTSPERVVLGVYKEWDTIKNIRVVGEFVVNVPSMRLLDEIWICGDKHAGNPIPRGVSELEIAHLTEIPSEKVRPPRIKECYGHLECVVNWIKSVGDHYLVLGEVVAASFTKGYLDDNFVVNLNKAKPAMEISHNKFTYPSKVVEVNMDKVTKRVDAELKRKKIKLSKRLQYYKKVVFSKE